MSQRRPTDHPQYRRNDHLKQPTQDEVQALERFSRVYEQTSVLDDDARRYETDKQNLDHLQWSRNHLNNLHKSLNNIRMTNRSDSELNNLLNRAINTCQDLMPKFAAAYESREALRRSLNEKRLCKSYAEVPKITPQKIDSYANRVKTIRDDWVAEKRRKRHFSST